MQQSQKTKTKVRKIGTLRLLVPYLRPYVWKIAVMFFCMITANVAALYIPGQVGDAIDAITTGEDITVLVVCMLCAAMAAWVLTAVQNILSVSVGQSVVEDMRKELFEHISHLPVSFFDGTTKGNLISIMVTDISNVSETMSTDLVTVLAGIVTVVGASIMMLRINMQMSLVFVITVPLIAITTYFLAIHARKFHRARKAVFGKLCGYTEEMLTAQKSLFVYGQEEVAHKEFCAISQEQCEKGIRADFCSGLVMPAMNGVTNLNYLLIAGVGAFLALNGSVTVGAISSFILYSKKFSAPIADTSNIIGVLQSSLAACERIFAVLAVPVEAGAISASTKTAAQIEQEKEGREQQQEGSFQIGKAQGKIEFSHVAFAYTPETPILRDIDFCIQPGQKVAIVGSTGAGKTTLISLLLRFYAATGGEIRLDDVPIADISLAQLRRQFAMVLQDGWLFDGTVYDNLVYAMPEHLQTRETVRALCREIGVEEMIESLPNAYDCVLRGDSTALSQGQKQLLSITRAFLCHPSVFILDEATSSIDPQTEHAIQEVTNRVLHGKTSIIIAHRLSTILSADCILVLKEGFVAERGTHEELLAKNGLYRQIFESQFAQ